MTATINASTSSGLITTADTSGELALQSNGTTQLTVSSTGTYGQLKSGTAQASTSGTSIDFTSIPSWVKRITVMLSAVSTNSTSNIQIQLGDSGGIENTGYISSANNGTTNATSTTGLLLTQSTTAASVHYGSMIISLIGSNIWVSQGTGALAAGGMFMLGGGKTLSDTLTQLRITTVGGTATFDAGSINILYEG